MIFYLVAGAFEYCLGSPDRSGRIKTNVKEIRAFLAAIPDNYAIKVVGRSIK